MWRFSTKRFSSFRSVLFSHVFEEVLRARNLTRSRQSSQTNYIPHYIHLSVTITITSNSFSITSFYLQHEPLPCSCCLDGRRLRSARQCSVAYPTSSSPYCSARDTSPTTSATSASCDCVPSRLLLRSCQLLSLPSWQHIDGRRDLLHLPNWLLRTWRRLSDMQPLRRGLHVSTCRRDMLHEGHVRHWEIIEERQQEKTERGIRRRGSRGGVRVHVRILRNAIHFKPQLLNTIGLISSDACASCIAICAERNATIESWTILTASPTVCYILYPNISKIIFFMLLNCFWNIFNSHCSFAILQLNTSFAQFYEPFQFAYSIQNQIASHSSAMETDHLNCNHFFPSFYVTE